MPLREPPERLEPIVPDFFVEEVRLDAAAARCVEPERFDEDLREVEPFEPPRLDERADDLLAPERELDDFEREAVRFAPPDLEADDLFAVDFLPADFLAVDFLAEDLVLDFLPPADFAADLRPEDLAADFRAEDFAPDFLAPDFRDDVLEADAFEPEDLELEERVPEAFLPEDFLAPDFAPALFEPDDFLAPLDLRADVPLDLRAVLPLLLRALVPEDFERDVLREDLARVPFPAVELLLPPEPPPELLSAWVFDLSSVGICRLLLGPSRGYRHACKATSICVLGSKQRLVSTSNISAFQPRHCLLSDLGMDSANAVVFTRERLAQGAARAFAVFACAVLKNIANANSFASLVR